MSTFDICKKSGTALARAVSRTRAGWRLGRMLGTAVLGLTLLEHPPTMSATLSPAPVNNVVKLRVLLVTTGNESSDLGLAYIRPALDEMGVPYDLLDSTTQTLSAATLSPGGCASATSGCIGNYNGIILTTSIVDFTPAEWGALHQYERDFKVRESVLSGSSATLYPSPFDSDPVTGCPIAYLDYGTVDAGSITAAAPVSAQWAAPAGGKTIFEYANTANPLLITDFAFLTVPRAADQCPLNGPKVTPLLKTGNHNLVVQLDYPDGRGVLFSSITNADFLIHSQVLAYEFINYATQGVFVGGRFVYMSTHEDDLFLPNEMWDTTLRKTNPNITFRLASHDVNNLVTAQNAFRMAHPLAGSAYKIDHAFNGSGAVVDPEAATLTANLTEDLVAAVVANKAQFRFINHTFTHADMDIVPVPANDNCDYPTLPQVAQIEAEINKNRTVWQLLGLPEFTENHRVLVSGNHSGLKDRKCTDYPELHPEMENVQSDDIPFAAGANPLFLRAAANVGLEYLASDSSQLNQNIEQYISQVDDGSPTDRLMLPRWPANVFYNTKSPTELVDEYNYIFHDRFLALGLDPCTVAGAVCEVRNYAQILAAESEAAVRHMLGLRKWPHYFHQTNLADYDGLGSTLIFDWLNAAFVEYEKLMKLPVKNDPYYLIGDKTRNKLAAKAASIQATWNRTTGAVTLSANPAVPSLLVTGIQGGELYGGQYIHQINVGTTPKSYKINQALTR